MIGRRDLFVFNHHISARCISIIFHSLLLNLFKISYSHNIHEHAQFSSNSWTSTQIRIFLVSLKEYFLLALKFWCILVGKG